MGIVSPADRDQPPSKPCFLPRAQLVALLPGSCSWSQSSELLSCSKVAATAYRQGFQWKDECSNVFLKNTVPVSVGEFPAGV